MVHASRQQPLVSPLYTQVTHLHYVFLRDKLGGTKGTGLNACLTTGAFLLDDENNSVGALIDGTLRTGFDTRWLAAMLTGHGHVIQDQLAPNPYRSHLFNLDEVWSYAKPVLLLASYLAGITTIAEIYINEKRFLFHFISPSPYRLSTENL